MGIIRVVCLAATAVFLVGAQERSGNQIFQIPPGWTRTDMQGVTTLSPSAEAKNLVVLMLAGRPLTGDFRATFDQDVKGTTGNLRVVAAGELQSRHTPDGVDLLAQTIELQAANGARSARYYMAASVGGRFEVLTYMAATPALFQKYWPAVQQFVPAWQFANLASPAAPTGEATGGPPPAGGVPPSPPAENASATSPGRVTGNRLEGVFSGYKFNMVNVLGAVQRSMVADYFSFFANGTVYWGLPQTGLVGFNMARACQGAVEFCGTYQVNGEQVTILLNRGTYRQVGVFSPGGLDIGGRPYKLQGDIAKSAAHILEGDWGRADAQPGEDLARRFIRFTRDGHFVDQGIVTTVTSSDISTGNPRFERQAGAGTYTLGPYTIILHYQDGYVRQLGVIIEPGDMDKPTLTKIFVNTYTLVRRR